MDKLVGFIRGKDRKINKAVQLTLLLLMFSWSFINTGCSKTSPKRAVNESSRDIPVAYDVDVVVIGGTSGGVAAAVEAAQNGAKVFLAAQRPYLGADLCATYRLWLEPGEVPALPLQKKVFAEPPVSLMSRNRINFTYETDITSAGVHKDTPSPSLLTDGKWHSASSQSVQYDGNVTIIADLGSEHQLENVHIMAYQRRNSADDFEVESVTVSISNDKQQWKQLAIINNLRLGESLPQPWGPIELSAPITGHARYVKFTVKKSPDVNRLLLGEIVISEKRSPVNTDKPPERIPPTPMQVKRTLDQALLEANVQFLYGCYATDVLVDNDDRVAGIVMANRSGRQAVKAKIVIDATPRASVARMAGAAFKPYPKGLQTFKRIVVGGGVRTGKDIQAKKMPSPISTQSGLEYTAVEYTLKIPMNDGSFASFAKAEQLARDKTWHPDQQDASEILFQVPPDSMKGKKTLSESWPGAEKVELDAFRPEGVDSLYVISGCADIPRQAAEKLLRPLELMKLGGRIGAAAAAKTKNIAKADNVKIISKPASVSTSGDIRENLTGIHRTLTESPKVHTDKRAVPILKEVDVVVVGGGTGGAPAGISAARQGAKTLVLEYLHGLGGVGTTGFISKYYYGNITGFTKEMDDGIIGFGGGSGKHKDGGWNITLKKEWYRRKLQQAGADIWFGVLGCGAFVDDGRVKGVVVATPEGRGVVLAKAIIDSTGNADIAAAAGADCEYTSGSAVAVQGAGLPGHNLGAGYTNTDWTFIDDTDVIDVWRAFVVAKNKFKNVYDLGQLVDTRERRRIVGDFVMSPLDISNNRTYPDTIVIARSNFDTHGFTVHPVFMLKPPDRKAMFVNVPYRCLLPKGLDGILVTGLGVSAHRDAIPVIRMQPDIQNQGYAAGLAAAMSARSGNKLRQIDIKALQKHLIELGSLPEQVLTEKDSYPLPAEKLEQAVESLVNDFDGLEIVLAHLKYTMPLLRRAYDNAEDAKAKLKYAHVLGMLGHSRGSSTLINQVKSSSWDKGWNYTGMGQFGESLSELDSLIIALGRTRDEKGLNPILEKIEQLDAGSEFSHYRALAIALETLGHPGAAEPLAKLLKKPGMTGHAFMDINDASNRTPTDPVDNSTRNLSLRELVLARALYRCGDYNDMGKKILNEYAHDLRGHYARHAREIINEQK